MHDYVNKIIKTIILIVYIVALVVAILGLTLLSLYFFLKTNVFRIFYVVIWNISMLVMYISILISALLGIVGYILKDATQVGQYILSPSNLNDADPLVFDPNDEYVSDLIDICANGNGDFVNLLNEKGYLTKNIENYKEYINSYKDKINAINSDETSECSSDDKSELNNYYKQLINLGYISLNITNNLTNIKCRFAKNDKNIILNEAESGGKRSVTICTFCFLVGILLGISIVFGILLVHRYKYENESEKGQKEANQNQKNMSETAEKIDENDNQTTLNINNLNDLQNNNNTNVDVIKK